MANLICAKCNEEITPEEMVECPHCWEIYHRECWEDTSNCVTCKKFNPIYQVVQAQKEAQQEEEENELQNKENEVEETPEDEQIETVDIKQNNVMSLVSNVMLALGAVSGIGLAIYRFVVGGITSGVVGVVIGVVIAVLGWICSVLINGFGELISNSQKNAYYLQKLVEKNKESEDE